MKMHNDALGRDLASKLSWILILICVLSTSRNSWIQVLELPMKQEASEGVAQIFAGDALLVSP